MDSIFDLNILERYVSEGLLRKAEDENLVQYNYSDYCNNSGCWDDITLFNRGNIYEKSTGKLIAKSLPKFMNFSQLTQEDQHYFLDHKKLITTEKKDGCLGILYMYNNEIRCNSRGAFNNYVTDKIKQLLPKYTMLDVILKFNTLIVEVISPETKIICDYGNKQELYLLTAYSNLDWEEYSNNQLDELSNIIRMPRPKKCYLGWQGLFKWQQEQDYTEEGFVVCIEDKQYGSYKRVKIKSNDYIRVSRIMAGLSKYKIWKIMKNDLEQNTQILKQYFSNLPDEIVIEAEQYKKELQEEYNKIQELVNQEFEKTKDIPIEKLYKYFEENPCEYKGCIYNLRNGKDISKIIIKFIEPKNVEGE